MTIRTLKIVVISVGLITSSLVVAGSWKKHKKKCETVFSTHSKVQYGKLKQCVSRFFGFVRAEKATSKQKKAIQSALQSLYDRSSAIGDGAGTDLALDVAEHYRIQVTTGRRRPSTDGDGTSTNDNGRKATDTTNNTNNNTTAEKFVCPAVSTENKAWAKMLFKKGVKAEKKKSNKSALNKFLSALKMNPCHVGGLYHAAAQFALKKDGSEAVKYLKRLRVVGSKKALRNIKLSRSEPKFAPIHGYVPFKKVSGYAKIKILNSLMDVGGNDLGALEIKRIKKTLENKRFNYPVAESGGKDKKQGRTYPVIFFKPHSAATAWFVRKVVLHPKTKLVKITDAKYFAKLNKSDFDIIVTWGNETERKPNGQIGPKTDYTRTSEVDLDKRMRKLDSAHNDALKKPEKAVADAERVVDTPDRVTRKVENKVDKVKKTGERVEKIFKKIPGVK
jgi:hypothetical protein